MTKTNRSSKYKKSVLLPVLAALIVILAASIYLYANRQDPNTQTDNSGPTAAELADEASANSDAKKQLVDNNEKTTDNQPSSAPPASAKSIALSAQQETNGTVTVFTKLPGYSSGTCKLTITNAGKSTTQEAPLMYQPEYSSCAGFSVPISPIGKGIWQITLNISSGRAIDSKSISYEVK